MNSLSYIRLLCLLALLSSCVRPGPMSKEEYAELDTENAEENTTLKQVENRDFIIEEVYQIGSRTEPRFSWSRPYMYDYDHYIKIHNPTKEVLYLDNLAMGLSAFLPNANIAFPKGHDFTKTHLNIRNMVYFPGSGKEHPVAPGASIVVAAHAVDHTNLENPLFDWSEGNINSIDLSGADWEWLTTGQMAEENYFFDNEEVPNMRSLFVPQWDWQKEQNDQEDGVLDNESPFSLRGFAGFIALFRIKAPLEELQYGFEKGVEYPYRWFYSVLSSNGKQMGANDVGYCLKIPNEWLTDAVIICTQDQIKEGVDIINPALCAGYTHAAHNSSATDKLLRAGYAVRRKHNNWAFEDTNNCTFDFEPVKVKSIEKAK